MHLTIAFGGFSSVPGSLMLHFWRMWSSVKTEMDGLCIGIPTMHHTNDPKTDLGADMVARSGAPPRLPSLHPWSHHSSPPSKPNKPRQPLRRSHVKSKNKQLAKTSAYRELAFPCLEQRSINYAPGKYCLVSRTVRFIHFYFPQKYLTTAERINQFNSTNIYHVLVWLHSFWGGKNHALGYGSGWFEDD